MTKLKPVRKTKTEEKLTSPPKFEPGKSYKWEPDDEFVLNGKEFSLLYQVLRAKADEANAVLACFNTLQALFEEGVKEGIVVPVEEQEDNQPKQMVIEK